MESGVRREGRLRRASASFKTPAHHFKPDTPHLEPQIGLRGASIARFRGLLLPGFIGFSGFRMINGFIGFTGFRIINGFIGFSGFRMIDFS